MVRTQIQALAPLVRSPPFRGSQHRPPPYPGGAGGRDDAPGVRSQVPLSCPGACSTFMSVPQGPGNPGLASPLCRRH
eukprot:9475111-Pyramimonas_sp.AAC.1